jgi:hypothetical protein
MAYDPGLGRVVMFSGASCTGSAADTWEYDGANWQQVFPSSQPPGRSGAVVAPISAASVIPATISLHPRTLNLDSQGRWTTAYIELPNNYGASDIDIRTVKLEDVIPAAAHSAEPGDQDGDGIPDLMVKFDRQAVIEYLDGTTGQMTLTVSGELTNGVLFEGSDTIAIVDLHQ